MKFILFSGKISYEVFYYICKNYDRQSVKHTLALRDCHKTFFWVDLRKLVNFYPPLKTENLWFHIVLPKNRRKLICLNSLKFHVKFGNRGKFRVWFILTVSFYATGLFLYPLKILEQFWMEKENSGMKWVKEMIS